MVDDNGRLWTARRPLNSDGLDDNGRQLRDGRRGMAREQWQWTATTTVMDDDGWHNGNLMVMDSVARWGWTVRWQLDGKGWRQFNSTAMDSEERCEHGGDDGTAGSGSDKGQQGIKT